MKKFLFGLMVLGVFLQTSCMVGKKIVYVNDMVPDSVYSIMKMPDLRVESGDRLSIIVHSKNPELSAPFNLGVGAYRVNDDGNISTTTDQSNSLKGYLVDKNNEITFPILGRLSLKDLTLDEVKNLIQNRLVQEQLLNDPLVSVELLNLKVLVTGAVQGQQVIHVPDGRITLIEAITQAGGLTNNSTADRISVIREEKGELKRVVNNIQSKDIFNSPTYYLKQNDIVFIEPKSPENTPREERSWRYFSTLLGAATLIISILTLTK